MNEDITIPIVWVSGIGSILAGVVSFVLRSHDKRLESIEHATEASKNATADVATNLAAYQLDSEKRFAKEESVQQSLARIHERMDRTATKDDVGELKGEVANMRNDIKVLIGKAGAA